MNQVQIGAIDMVGKEGATGATVAEVAPPHEVVDDQLAAAIKQIGKTSSSLGSIEDITLLHSDPWQRAACRAYGISLLGELFLLNKELLAGDKPLLPGNDICALC